VCIQPVENNVTVKETFTFRIVSHLLNQFIFEPHAYTDTPQLSRAISLADHCVVDSEWRTEHVYMQV